MYRPRRPITGLERVKYAGCPKSSTTMGGGKEVIIQDTSYFWVGGFNFREFRPIPRRELRHFVLTVPHHHQRSNALIQCDLKKIKTNKQLITNCSQTLPRFYPVHLLVDIAAKKCHRQKTEKEKNTVRNFKLLESKTKENASGIKMGFQDDCLRVPLSPQP